MKNDDPKGTSAAKKLARKKAEKNKRLDQRNQTTSNKPYEGSGEMAGLERAWKNPQNSKVTSNLPSVNNSWRRDFGSYLTKPEESYRDSSGKTGIRDFEPGRDPKYVWKDARDAAAKKKK
jgi:hypothetical protein